MKDLCVPIPNFGDEEFAEIELRVGERKINYQYRVVSFRWDVESDKVNGSDDITLSLVRIGRLREAIEGYDKNWELIQIFNPSENSKNIQVLYRKK